MWGWGTLRSQNILIYGSRYSGTTVEELAIVLNMKKTCKMCSCSGKHQTSMSILHSPISKLFSYHPIKHFPHILFLLLPSSFCLLFLQRHNPCSVLLYRKGISTQKNSPEKRTSFLRLCVKVWVNYQQYTGGPDNSLLHPFNKYFLSSSYCEWPLCWKQLKCFILLFI